MVEQDRLRELAAAMRQRNTPLLLLSNLPDVRYLTGFTGSNAALVVRSRPRVSARLFTDGRYTVQAREQVKAATIRITRSVLGEACTFAAGSGCASCAFDGSYTTVAALATMRSAVRKAGVPGSFLRPWNGAVERLRTLKSADEMNRIRRAADLTCTLYEGMLSWIEAGMREREVAAELEHRASLAGAQSMSFETIVAGGQRGSQPHARATDAPLRPGDLLTLDFGVVLDGYCSDMTRTVAFGFGGTQVPRKDQARWREQRTVFDAVLAAQQQAVEAVRAGVTCDEVDAAARDLLKQAGLGKYFSHSTGHGVGLEIHEAPRVAKAVKTKLESGMVITIEPGVYLPGRFGVRIEDTVLVTEGGAEILTPVHKGWLEL